MLVYIKELTKTQPRFNLDPNGNMKKMVGKIHEVSSHDKSINKYKIYSSESGITYTFDGDDLVEHSIEKVINKKEENLFNPSNLSI